ncbi:hypothetical protein D3C71_1695800 [compost metagenome]
MRSLGGRLCVGRSDKIILFRANISRFSVGGAITLEPSLRLKSVCNVALILLFRCFSFSVIWFIWLTAI